jgi:hypothetical protein
MNLIVLFSFFNTFSLLALIITIAFLFLLVVKKKKTI